MWYGGYTAVEIFVVLIVESDVALSFECPPKLLRDLLVTMAENIQTVGERVLHVALLHQSVYSCTF
jgi:hypothetical protein